jgi:hypothetical protein
MSFEALKPPRPALWQPAPLQPLVADVSEAQLQQLRTRMALLERCRVNVARMGLDRLYALEVLAVAHASADEGLRTLAMALFAGYERGAVAHH